MPVTVTNADGVTVVALTSDPDSACPPVCQILMALCYQPACCSSVFTHKSRVQSPSESVLGALLIMAGTLTIGLGGIINTNGSQGDVGFPFWTGAVFMFCGIMRIVCEKFCHPYLVIINMVLILAEFGFAMAAIILWAITLSMQHPQNLCNDIMRNTYNFHDSWYDHSRMRVTEPPETITIKTCQEAEQLLTVLLKTMSITLLMLFTLVLGVVIITVILRIDANCNREEGKNKDTEDSEVYQALLQDVPINPTV